jgi:hypothetical protein
LPGKDLMKEKNSPGKKRRGISIRYNTLSVVSLAVIVVLSLVFTVAFYKKAPGEPVKRALGWGTMRVDGDRNGFFVEFSHENHMKLPKEGCTYCHHLPVPLDSVTPCYLCHSHMDSTSSIFDHERHAAYYKKNGRYCDECHTGIRAREYAKKCIACHSGYDKGLDYYLSARSYTAAMHDRCIPCHRAQDAGLSEKIYSDCGFCHSKLPANRME